MQLLRGLLAALVLLLVAASGVAAQSRVLFVPISPAFNDQVEDGKPLPAGMDATPLFGGEQIASASLGTDQLDQPAIDLVLEPDGAGALDDWAAAHFQERLAMVVDGTVVTAPVINATRFNGQIQISANFTLEEANALLELINDSQSTVIATGEEAAALVRASDPRFTDLARWEHLTRQAISTFDLSVYLTTSFYRAVPSSLSRFLELFPGASEAWEAGGWVVEIMLVDGCTPVTDVRALTGDPCTGRHAWSYRVERSGTLTLLFEEGDPIPSGN